MRVAVVGGGLAGLTAAHDLAAAGADVVVLEGADHVGGKLLLGEVGGLTLDLGAESVLAKRPEGLDLISRVGLADLVVHPATIHASIWTKGALRPLPPTVMGVPSDLGALRKSGILGTMPTGRSVPMPDDDVSVTDFLEPRVGREVVDRLVEPLLGGVYAGHADRLSLHAAAPQVRDLGPDPLAGAAEKRARPAPDNAPEGPVFAGLVGGVGQLPLRLAESGGFEVRLSTTVRSVTRAGSGWELAVGPTTAIETIRADAVVVAAPGPAAARLLADAAPEAAFALAGIEYAGMAIATFVLDGPIEAAGSGFLVPPIDGTVVKAATFSSAKWGWVADAAGSRTVLRASIGRAGESTILHQRDDHVVELALTDLRAAMGDLPRVVDSHVQRWGGALPQYDVGHLGVVQTIEASVAGVRGLEVCGAAYRGIGIPAVIASARGAAARVLTDVTDDEGE